MAGGSDRAVPPGRERNPSAWAERIPLALLAIAGCALATYLALYQIGVIATVWEPFFGDGSRRILNSLVARFLPVPDAALGALAYGAEALFGIVGGATRWRTAPWVVLIYGGLVAALGFGSVALVIAQPVAFGAWCTACLASAAISIGLLVLAWREPLAALQTVRREVARGATPWRALRGATGDRH